LYRFALICLVLFGVFGMAFAQVNLDATPQTKTIEVGKQVQIAADLKNNQDFEQEFAYIVQVQDEKGVTVSLAWITGVLSAAQSFSPSLSWTPSEAGNYEATIFVWESIDNPSALSPTLSLKINVGSAA
jgi:predicted secreted hydrolase